MVVLHNFFEDMDITFDEETWDNLPQNIKDDLVTVFNETKKSTYVQRALDQLTETGLLIREGPSLMDEVEENFKNFEYLEKKLGIRLMTEEEILRDYR